MCEPHSGSRHKLPHTNGADSSVGSVARRHPAIILALACTGGRCCETIVALCAAVLVVSSVVGTLKTNITAVQAGCGCPCDAMLLAVCACTACCSRMRKRLWHLARSARHTGSAQRNCSVPHTHCVCNMQHHKLPVLCILPTSAQPHDNVS
jgi:hypothetical protein